MHAILLQHRARSSTFVVGYHFRLTPEDSYLIRIIRLLDFHGYGLGDEFTTLFL